MQTPISREKITPLSLHHQTLKRGATDQAAVFDALGVGAAVAAAATS